VTSCLELVRSGDLNISDAEASFALWGHQNDESLSRKLSLLRAMEKEDEETPVASVTPTPSRSPYGVIHTPLPEAEKDEFDLGDLGILMSLIKGLGLQLPTDDNDTVTTEANDKKITEFLKPDMTEEELLGMFSGFLNGGAGDGEGAEGENMREIEWLLENDPAAAAELLVPLLAGGEAQLQEYLQNVTDWEPVSATTEAHAVAVTAGGENGTVLAVAEEDDTKEDTDEAQTFD